MRYCPGCEAMIESNKPCQTCTGPDGMFRDDNVPDEAIPQDSKFQALINTVMEELSELCPNANWILAMVNSYPSIRQAVKDDPWLSLQLDHAIADLNQLKTVLAE